MHTISLPQKTLYTELGENRGKFEVLGCYPGYGATLGNALRRVLLSSLSGAAAKSVKISGVTHEFTTLPGVMEDMVQILLNVKQIRFRLHSDEPVTVTVKGKGEGAITAKDIKCPSSVEVVNGDQVIATLTDKKATFEMEIVVDSGIGYVPIEARENEEREIGVIAVDSIYTPVKRVNYEVENMRVGKRTDYDKVTLEVVTDGTIAPEEAFKKSVDILVAQFSALTEVMNAADETAEKESAGEEPASEVVAETPVEAEEKDVEKA